MDLAGQFGEVLSRRVGRHCSIVDLTTDRPLKHGRVDECGFGMRVSRRVTARAVFEAVPRECVSCSPVLRLADQPPVRGGAIRRDRCGRGALRPMAPSRPRFKSVRRADVITVLRLRCAGLPKSRLLLHRPTPRSTGAMNSSSSTVSIGASLAVENSAKQRAVTCSRIGKGPAGPGLPSLLRLSRS
jgi:hypothetical protein